MREERMEDENERKQFESDFTDVDDNDSDDL